MIELEKLSLKNIIVHKNTNIDFSNKGIYLIRGENASGKSLLFNSIPNIFDGAPPLLKKKDTKAIHGEDSAIGIKYKFNNKEYKVVQLSKKGSISYKIEEDGKELDPRTQTIAKEYLEKIFPISSSHYYSLIHLTPYRSSILLSGTGPQRKEFFEELFHLSYSEYILEKIKSKLNELKRRKDEKEILENQAKDLQYIDNLEELKERLNELNIKYENYERKYQEYTKNIQIITSINNYKNQLKTKFSEDKLKEKKKDIEEKLKYYENILEQKQLELKRYYENEENIKKKEELLKELNKLKELKLEDKETIKLKYEKLKEELKKKEQLKEEKENSNNKLERFNFIFEKIKNILDNLKDIKSFNEAFSLISNNEKTISNNKILINKLTKLESEIKCPTCNQRLNKEEIKNLLEKCSLENKEKSILIENKELILEYFKLKELNLEYFDLNQLDEDIKNIRENLRNLKSNYEKLKEEENLENQIKCFPKIIDIEKISEGLLDRLREKINKGKDLLKIIDHDIDIKFELSKIIITKELEDYSILEEKINKISPKLKEINEERMELNSKIKLGEVQNNQIISINSKIENINKELEDFDIYEALSKAYGAKGIKIDQIKYLADMFCKNLNKYSNLVYNRPIKFYINVDTNNFNILAERNGKPAGDVCLLSGAESRSFLLLCALSLLPFIPEKYRTDFIILDEIEAGMKENTRNFITQGFFKALQNIVPKIIIVTPMDQKEFYIESDKEFYLKLKNNETTIEIIK